MCGVEHTIVYTMCGCVWYTALGMVLSMLCASQSLHYWMLRHSMHTYTVGTPPHTGEWGIGYAPFRVLRAVLPACNITQWPLPANSVCCGLWTANMNADLATQSTYNYFQVHTEPYTFTFPSSVQYTVKPQNTSPQHCSMCHKVYKQDWTSHF